MKGAKCRLHPLIHTLLEFNLAQYVEKCLVIGQQKKPPPTGAPLAEGGEKSKIKPDSKF
jgi:hypothetical protein